MTKLLARLCIAVLSPALLSYAQSGSTSRTPDSHPSSRSGHYYDSMPLAFESNHGQSDASVTFLSRGSGYTVLLQPRDATLLLHKASGTATQRELAAVKGRPQRSSSRAVTMHLLDANQDAAMTPERALPGYVSYMSGPDHSKWQIGLPTYAATRVSQAYPGIDLVYYGTGRQLEYDFVVAPSADPGRIRLALRGATPVLESTGELRLQAGRAKADSDMVFRKPVIYQRFDGKRVSVDGSYTVADSGEVSFHIAPYDHTRELIIDPIISYASYFGGSGEDEINGSALNTSNQLYAVGQTFSASLPGTSGEFETGSAANNNGHDAFVTKFSADGSTVLWTTYLSGAGDDFATSVAVNAADQAYVTGYTASCGSNGTSVNTPGEFPFTSDAVQPLCNPNVIGFNNYESNGGGYDVFLVKLSSDGKTELYGTPLGGSNNDIAQTIALDAAGQVYIVGETQSTGYHYAVEFKNDNDTPAYPINNHGQPSIGTANYPTTANAFYSNTTESKQYATTSTDGTMNGPTDEQAFITVLSADLHTLVYSSLIGGGVIGGCGNGACNTNGLALTVSNTGIAYIGGNTSSAHWPTTPGAFAPTCSNAGLSSSQCPMTGWIAAFDTTKSGTASLIFSSYVNGSSGGTNGDSTNIYPSSDVYGLAIDSAGNVVLTGDTGANNFPTTTGTLQTTCSAGTGGGGQVNQCSAAYILKLSPTGSILWSTYYGSASPTSAGAYIGGSGVALDATDNVYVVGSGNETVAVKNPIVATPQGNPDVFLIELAPDASKLLMGTWLGATAGLSLNTNTLHLDSSLNAYFSGYQCPNSYGGTSFPTTANAFDKTIQGCDGYVVKIATQQQPTSTALQITPTTGAPSTPITFTATVIGTAGLAAPTGTVALTSGASTIGTITLTNGTGTGTYTTSTLSGTYSVVATYSGDAAYATSASAATTLTLTTTPTVALTATPTSATFGSTITLKSIVTGISGTPTGTIYFMDGTSTLGSMVLASGSASFSTTALAAGTHSLTARYSGDSNYAAVNASPAVTVTINALAAPTVSLTATPATAVVGTTIVLASKVAGTGGTPSGTVTFLDGAATLNMATLTSGTASFATTTLAVGTHTITARYSGDTVFSVASSSTVTVTITAAAASLTLSANPSSLTVTHGSTVTSVITATPVGGFTGTVTFTCGNLPSYATCGFAPTTLTFTSTSTAQISTLTFATGTATTSNLVFPGSAFTSSIVMAILFMPLAFTRRARKVLANQGIVRLLMVAIFALLAATGLSGCGGSSTSTTTPTTTTTAVGTYTVPVTVSGGTASTLNLTINVQ